MRHGRAKAARRTLDFFARTAGIRPPYHLLLDATFVVAVCRYKLGEEIRHRLDKLLQHSAPRLVMTRSSLRELEQLIGAQRGTNSQSDKNTGNESFLLQALQWSSKHCRTIVEDEDIAPLRSEQLHEDGSDLSQAGQDILSLVLSTPLNGKEMQDGNNGQDQKEGEKDGRKYGTLQPPYFLASQDEALLDRARQSGRVPVIRLARGSVLLLEQPSKAACQAADQQERSKWTARGSVRSDERELADAIRQKERAERQQQLKQQQQQQQQQSRRKQKAKGPNPLSCKKKKRTTTGSEAVAASGQEQPSKNKRRRRRNNDSGTDNPSAT